MNLGPAAGHALQAPVHPRAVAEHALDAPAAEGVAALQLDARLEAHHAPRHARTRFRLLRGRASRTGFCSAIDAAHQARPDLLQSRTAGL